MFATEGVVQELSISTFLFNPGLEVVEQALDGAKAVLNGNCNSALVVFFPVAMSKADQPAVLKKKRLLEDKLMQNLSCFDVMTQEVVV